jgi:hypothetical protein
MAAIITSGASITTSAAKARIRNWSEWSCYPQAGEARLSGHEYSDVVVLVQLSDFALEHPSSFASNDWIGEAMKLGHEAPALPVQISIRDRHVEDCLSGLAAASPDHYVGISACTAIAVHDHPFANHGERCIKGVLI